MGIRGRKPKPTAIKRLQGNPGRHPMNDAEPRTEAKAPKRPEHLNTGGQVAWRWLVRTLKGMGLLAASDLALMTIYCDTWSQYVMVLQQLAGLGPGQFVLKSMSSNNFYGNPLFDREIVLKKQLMACLSELGFSPTSRARLRVAPKQEHDPMSDLLSKLQEHRSRISSN